jgi:hypothetical protein
MLVGFGLWLIVALVQGLAVIADPAATAGPAELLRSDRASGLRQGLITGIFGAALIVAVVWEQFEFTYHLVSGTLCWVLAWAFAALAATGMWVFPGMVLGAVADRTLLAGLARLPAMECDGVPGRRAQQGCPPAIRRRLPVPARPAPAVPRGAGLEPRNAAAACADRVRS